MDLQDIGAIGEAIGGIAVIFTLLYLALQIKQNTVAMHSTTSRETVRNFAGTIAWLGTSPSNASVFHRGLFQFDSLNSDEQTHFQLMLTNVFLNADVAYRDWNAGILGDQEWGQILSTLRFYFSLSAGPWAWNRSVVFLSKDFRDFIEEEFPVAETNNT